MVYFCSPLELECTWRTPFSNYGLSYGVTEVLFKKMETKRSRVDFLTFLKTLSLLKSSLERGRSVVVDNTHVDVEAR